MTSMYDVDFRNKLDRLRGASAWFTLTVDGVRWVGCGQTIFLNMCNERQGTNSDGKKKTNRRRQWQWQWRRRGLSSFLHKYIGRRRLPLSFRIHGGRSRDIRDGYRSVFIDDIGSWFKDFVWQYKNFTAAMSSPNNTDLFMLFCRFSVCSFFHFDVVVVVVGFAIRRTHRRRHKEAQPFR